MTDAKPNADARVMRDLERISRNVARESALFAKPLRTIRVEDLPAEVHESADKMLRRILSEAMIEAESKATGSPPSPLSRDALINQFDNRLHELLKLVPHVVELLPNDRIVAGLGRIAHFRNSELHEMVGLLLPLLSFPDGVRPVDQVGDRQLFDQPGEGKDLGLGRGAEGRVAVEFLRGLGFGHRIISSASELARRTVAGLARLFNRGA